MKYSFSSLYALAALTASAGAAITTLPVTGWAEDLVINNPPPFNASVTSTMDNGFGNVENNTWIEAGTYPVWNGTEVVSTSVNGLPSGSGPIVSASGSGASFQFQDYSGLNALFLTGDDGNSMSGTLTLIAPSLMSTLAFYGANGGGATSASVQLTFADSSTSTYLIADNTGITRDWFAPEASSLGVTVGGRASNRSEEGYSSIFYQENSVISVHESLINLDGADQAKLIESITLTNTGGGRLSVFAVSAEVIPEPSSMGLAGLAGLLALARRRRA